MFNPNDPLALPQIQTDLMRGQRDLQFADALMNAGYVPNSGALGAVSQIAQAFMGRKLSRKADEKISDALKRQFEADNARAAQEAQRKAEDDERNYRKAIERRAEEAQRMGLQGADAQRYAVTGDIPEASKPNVMKVGNQLVSIGPDGAAQVIHSAPQQARAPSDIERRIALAQQMGATTEQIRSLVLGGGSGQSAPSGYRFTDGGELAPIPGGPADPKTQAKPAALTAEAKNKLALIDNAIANAKRYNEAVTTGDDFSDISARTGPTPGLMRAAIQDMLYAKSGASAPESEVAKWEDIYGPSMFERDSTSAAKVSNFIRDLEAMRKSIVGDAPMPQQQAPAQAGGWSIQLVN